MDNYEKQLIKDIENNEFVSVPNVKKEIKRYASYARNYLKKEKRITLRVAKRDIEKIQEKAIETGIPYQTLIGSLIKQYANGKISIAI
ncbi:antitoxin [Candidatus Roizmanbacteria bacterium CG02_land_8_20_14_3_00_36_15]|uniref:Antitoxin n=2 Tax=Candidatus Roizmaniibacteriota TaxID=1752723 RepID=A0A2M8F2Z3_9BACT|nr:MAG: antitoxin [Candidatus Roizmanbacteria bacterium CG11_big_fil_rev_8_21_14_0_20_35_14]PIV38312.1 MAG: antitoxin [Candidatus Roizmanbacteria bacterium CG02_land_8_20_14_3_00_36_15]PJC33631.1 MAG: antitoxin [Candidatus Roizmanbacteria bacterium CG_4_9_14_0_2_um_filter_36_12]